MIIIPLGYFSAQCVPYLSGKRTATFYYFYQIVPKWTFCLTWSETMVEVMRIMVTSFKTSHARTAAISAPDAGAGHHWPMPLPETLGYSWARLGQSLVGSLFLSPGYWCTQGFVCVLQESVSPVLCKFWWLCGGVNVKLLQEGLCHTQVCCTQRPWPCGNKGPSSQSYGFSSGHVWMWELDYKESWAPKNWCFWTVVLEKTLESPLDCKEIQPVHPKGDQFGVHWKDWYWSWNSDTLATWYKELTHLKRPWCWERLRARGEGDDRGWDGWMVSPTQWTGVWVNTRSWQWTGKPSMLQSMGLQRVRHDWETKLNWSELLNAKHRIIYLHLEYT